MSLTENLLPGDRADEKKPVGQNFSMHYDTTAEIPPELREPAIRTVAARARDAVDARLLLDVLGLIEPCNDGWKRTGDHTDTAQEAL